MKGEKGNIVLVHFRGHDVAGVVTSATDSFCGVRITHTRTIWPKHEDIIRILEPQSFQSGQKYKPYTPLMEFQQEQLLRLLIINFHDVGKILNMVSNIPLTIKKSDDSLMESV